jgi:FkbM family methyltransferase
MMTANPLSMAHFIENAKQRLTVLGTAYRRAFGRIAEIASGPAKGLRFDAGPHTQRFASGHYERPVQEALAMQVSRGDVCYDIGANLGFFSVLLGRLAGPSGLVYAFEPVPGNASIIERNARLNQLPSVEVLRVALCGVDGREELLLAHHVGGAVLKSAGTPPDLAGSLMVETASLDTLVERQRIKPPNIVKIDVEGAEMDVLQGMERVLRKWAPILFVELDDETAAACEKKVSMCRSFLHDLGYQSELLPNAYPDGPWFVRHFLAQRGKHA